MKPHKINPPIPWGDLPKHFVRVSDAVNQIKAKLGNYSRAAFYRDVSDMKIEQAGIRQRPALYPMSAINLILARRGYVAPADTAARALQLPTLAELRRVKPAKTAKGKAKR